MDCRQIYLSLSQAGAITTDRYTMVDEYGNYVFYDVLGSTLLSGITYSTGASVSNFTLTSFTQSGSWTECGMANDVDTNAFISAANITDSTQKSAIRKLVTDLKTSNTWNKFNAVYPFVGGSSFSHKFNLKDPRDLDAAFRINWIGGVTHSSNGIQANGTNGYGNTNLNPLTHMVLYDSHLSVYSRTNVAEASSDLAVVSAGNNPRLNIHSRWTDNNTYVDVYSSAASSRVTFAGSNSLGFFVGTRRADNDMEAYSNGSSIGIKSTTVTNFLTNLNMYICCQNSNGTPAMFSTREYAFATMGLGLTSQNVSDLYTIIQTFQTTLGRNV